MPKVVDPSLKKGERFMQKVMKMYKNDLARILHLKTGGSIVILKREFYRK